MSFVHHLEGDIVVNDLQITVEDFLKLEPDYALPDMADDPKTDDVRIALAARYDGKKIDFYDAKGHKIRDHGVEEWPEADQWIENAGTYEERLKAFRMEENPEAFAHQLVFADAPETENDPRNAVPLDVFRTAKRDKLAYETDRIIQNAYPLQEQIYMRVVGKPADIAKMDAFVSARVNWRNGLLEAMDKANNHGAIHAVDIKMPAFE